MDLCIGNNRFLDVDVLESYRGVSIMKLRKYKQNQVSKWMLQKAHRGEINFQINAGDVVYVLFAGMISKIEGNKVSVFDGKGFVQEII